jgi:nucleoside-diphosphate-sugar epimerase
MKVCITGAGGFIGSYLCKTLEAQNIDIFRWSVKKPDDLGECNILVHLAARAHQMKDAAKDPIEEYRKTNRDLTFQLARTALKTNVQKFIFISTVKVVGEKPGIYDLESQCDPSDPYGISKKEAEDGLKELFINQSTIKCIILRLPLVYGPGNKGNMLTLLKAAEKRIPLPLASVKNQRSMISVSNVCDAIITAINDAKLNRSQFRTYFLTDGRDLTSGELYSTIYHSLNGKKGIFAFLLSLLEFTGTAGSFLEYIFGKKIPLNRETISRLLDEYKFDSVEFQNDYNWLPPVLPEDSIQETVQWFLMEKHKSHIIKKQRIA